MFSSMMTSRILAPPLCECLSPTRIALSRTTAHPDRPYYACAQTYTCDYFHWKDEYEKNMEAVMATADISRFFAMEPPTPLQLKPIEPAPTPKRPSSPLFPKARIERFMQSCSECCKYLLMSIECNQCEMCDAFLCDYCQSQGRLDPEYQKVLLLPKCDICDTIVCHNCICYCFRCVADGDDVKAYCARCSTSSLTHECDIHNSYSCNSCPHECEICCTIEEEKEEEML